MKTDNQIVQLKKKLNKSVITQELLNDNKISRSELCLFLGLNYSCFSGKLGGFSKWKPREEREALDFLRRKGVKI